jgi:hypothetical protein
MSEHRSAPRRRLLKAGTIEFGGGAIDCTVRNVSNTGAALDVISPVGIPEQFTLILPAKWIASVVPCRMAQGKADRRGFRLRQSKIY